MKCLGIVLAIVAATTHAGEPRTLYVRAQIEKATSGTVVVTSQYEPVLDLPSAGCVDGEFSCLTEQQYGQLYRFDFLFTQLRKTDTGQDVDESSAGTIYLAADMDKAQELQFEEAVNASIALLHGGSFRHAYAGWSVGFPPFVQEVLFGSSNQSAWLCMEHEDAERELRITPQIDNGQVVGGTQASAAKPVVGKACESLRAARRLEGGRSTTTPYDIESLVRTEIIVSVDWYRGDSNLGGFQSLPDEMNYSKTKVDRRHSRASMSVEDGVVSVEQTGNGVSQKLRLGTYAIEPPRPHSAAWVTRWMISTYEQTFGSEATEELLDRQELWIVALPLRDPLAEVDAAFPDDPGETLLDTVLGSFDRAARLSSEFVAQAFHHVARSLEGDWMFIYCPARGVPKYSIARFPARAAIQNGDDVCDVVRGLYAAN